MKNVNRPRIVNIDDNEATRYALSRILTQAGYEVKEAGTGEEGLRLISEKPDLILLDIQLPDMSGYVVCDRVRENPEVASIPIIQISASHVSNEDQAFGLEGGADAYLVQPVSPAVLVATANAMIRMRYAEQELKKVLQEQNKVLERLMVERSLREQFVSALTHDLRSPLSAARMSAQILSRNTERSEDVQRHSKRIITHVDRVDTMISNLLDVGRVRAGEKLHFKVTEINLCELVGETVEELSVIHGNRFVVHCDPSIEGHWDAFGLRRTIENLCINAVKYGSAEEQVRFEGKQVGESVQLSINNQGDPLSSEELSYLFEPYRRTKTAETSGQKGWGLGLTLVKGFAESHGGHVRVTSSPEEGTTFRVTLPKDSSPFLESG